jgi:hypothetical protein
MAGGLRSATDQCAEISELLLTLEKSNPTPEPAKSAKLNGVWTLQYAGALGAGVVDSPTREIALSIYSSSYSAGVLQQLLSKLPFDAGLQDVTSEPRLPSKPLVLPCRLALTPLRAGHSYDCFTGGGAATCNH